MQRKSRVPELPLVLFSSVLSFFFPFVFGSLPLLWKIIGYCVIAVLTGYTFIILKRSESSAALPAFWFFLIHLYAPVGYILHIFLPFSFLGITYFAITLLLLILIRRYSKWSEERDSFRLGSIDWISVLLIIVVSACSGLGLYLWVRIIKPDLSEFLEMMPDFSLGLTIAGGFGFALSNAFVEELFFRGFLWSGLSSTAALTTPGGWAQQQAGIVIKILITALLFGIWHFRGFPGGLVGMILVFVWGIFLGILRERSQGLLAPWLAHVAADMTIFGILCGLSW